MAEKALPERLTKETYMRSSTVFYISQYTVEKDRQLHWHDFYELEFILSGSGTHNVNGVTHRLSEGSCFLLTPADFHEYFVDEGSVLELINVKFSDQVLCEDVKNLLFKNGATLIIDRENIDADSLKREFKFLLLEYQRAQPGRMSMLEGGLERIIVWLLRQKKNTAKNSLPILNDSIYKACIYIQYNFREPITLEQIAKVANLTPNYFSECFHKMVGIPFQKFLRNTRLEFALSLLTCSSISVTEVCFASGFHSLTHFLKAFKKAYGQSPNEWRKK